MCNIKKEFIMPQVKQLLIHLLCTRDFKNNFCCDTISGIFLQLTIICICANNNNNNKEIWFLYFREIESQVWTWKYYTREANHGQGKMGNFLCLLRLFCFVLYCLFLFVCFLRFVLYCLNCLFVFVRLFVRSFVCLSHWYFKYILWLFELSLVDDWWSTGTPSCIISDTNGHLSTTTDFLKPAW